MKWSVVFNTPQYINMAGVDYAADPLDLQDSDFQFKKDERPPGQNPVLLVNFHEAFDFFVNALLNYMKFVFKEYYHIEYIQAGEGQKREHHYKGDGMPYDQQRQEFLNLYEHWCPNEHIPKFTNERVFADVTDLLNRDSVEHAFWNTNNNFQIPQVYKDFREQANQHDGFIVPAKMSEEHVRKVLANEVVRSAGVLMVACKNADNYERGTNDIEQIQDNDARPEHQQPVVSDVVLLAFLKAVVHGTRTMQQVFSTRDTAVRRMQQLYHQDRDEAAYNPNSRDTMIQNTIIWYFTSIGFFSDTDHPNAFPNIHQSFHIRLTQLQNSIISMRWSAHAFRALYHGYLLGTHNMPTEPGERGWKVPPTPYRGGDNDKAYKPKMYYCTQLYFMYLHRRMHMRTKVSEMYGNHDNYNRANTNYKHDAHKNSEVLIEGQ